MSIKLSRLTAKNDFPRRIIMNYGRNSSCKNTASFVTRTPFEKGVAMPYGGASCASSLSCIDGKSLAMVYAPCQRFENIYECSEALAHGTLFIALDKPFTGRKCV